MFYHNSISNEALKTPCDVINLWNGRRVRPQLPPRTTHIRTALVVCPQNSLYSICFENFTSEMLRNLLYLKVFIVFLLFYNGVMSVSDLEKNSDSTNFGTSTTEVLKIFEKGNSTGLFVFIKKCLL